MTRDELEQWLLKDESHPLSPLGIADALGLPVEELADTTLLRTATRVRSLRFTLAALRDAYCADIDVWRWLETPRHELGGVTPRSALVAGLEAEVEFLALRTWNARMLMVGAA